MNMFRTASTIRKAILPSLPEGYFRKNVAAVLGFLGPITPVHGKMFNPETSKILSNGFHAIEHVLSKIPESNFTQWIG